MATGPGNVYTASFAFFEAIWEAGITHCFVNLGSDHPSIIEAMVKGQQEAKGKFPRIITCPNEVKKLYRGSLTQPTRSRLTRGPPANDRWWPCPWQTATPG